MKLFSWIALGLMATTEASKYSNENCQKPRKNNLKNSFFSCHFNIKTCFLYVVLAKIILNGHLYQNYCRKKHKISIME